MALRLVSLGFAVALLAAKPFAAEPADASLALIPNEGQWRDTTLFAARLPGGALRIERAGLVVRWDDETGSRDVLSLRLHGDEVVDVVPGDALPGVHHFLVGERQRWRTHVRATAEISYKLASGASLRITGAPQGVRMSLERGPGSGSPLALHLEADGAWDAELAAYRIQGGTAGRLLRLAQAESQVTTAWQVEASQGAEHARLGPPASGDIPADLTLEWATFIGGSGTDHGKDLAVDSEGRIVLVGSTFSPDFPTTPGSMVPEKLSSLDGFISILDDTGSELLVSTHFGGDGGDHIEALDIAHDGSLVIAGTTSSTDFPVTPGAFARIKTGTRDLYIARLTPDADDVLAASYIGGAALNPPERMRDVAAAPDGDMVLIADVPDGYPTTAGAFQPQFGGGSDDVVVTRFTPDATALVFSTYLGGPGGESAHSVQVDAAGAVTLCGGTGSEDFPVTPGSLRSSVGVGAFVTRVAADGAALDLSFTIGPGTAVAVHEAADGAFLVAGRTSSDEFPVTPGAFDTTLEENIFQINYDLFLCRLAPGATEIEWATYLGTILPEFDMLALAVDSAGTPTIVGGTPSQLFPTTPGAHHQEGGSFATRFHRSGSRLLYSTLANIGYINDKFLLPVHMDSTGALIVAGSGVDGTLTTPGAFDETTNGSEDGHIAKLAMLPVGVSRFGTSSPGVQGPIAAGVLAMPWQGNAGFGLTVTNGPPLAHTWLALALGALVDPLNTVGVALWVDPATLLGLVPVQTDVLGYAELRVPIPDDPVVLGLDVSAQFVFPPSGGAAASASNALRLVVQPAPE